jgi:hypothetical protein
MEKPDASPRNAGVVQPGIAAQMQLEHPVFYALLLYFPSRKRRHGAYETLSGKRACLVPHICTDRLEEATVRLRHAIEIDKENRRLALDDEDLKPLWDWTGGLE